jgi:hypothetical protein
MLSPCGWRACPLRADPAARQPRGLQDGPHLCRGRALLLRQKAVTGRVVGPRACGRNHAALRCARLPCQRDQAGGLPLRQKAVTGGLGGRRARGRNHAGLRCPRLLCQRDQARGPPLREKAVTGGLGRRRACSHRQGGLQRPRLPCRREQARGPLLRQKAARCPWRGPCAGGLVGRSPWARAAPPRRPAQRSSVAVTVAPAGHPRRVIPADPAACDRRPPSAGCTASCWGRWASPNIAARLTVPAARATIPPDPSRTRGEFHVQPGRAALQRHPFHPGL